MPGKLTDAKLQGLKMYRVCELDLWSSPTMRGQWSTLPGAAKVKAILNTDAIRLMSEGLPTLNKFGRLLGHFSGPTRPQLVRNSPKIDRATTDRP